MARITKAPTSPMLILFSAMLAAGSNLPAEENTEILQLATEVTQQSLIDAEELVPTVPTALTPPRSQ